MSRREHLLRNYDVSEERVDLLLKANPDLTAGEIADKEGLEEFLEYVDHESYGVNKDEDRL